MAARLAKSAPFARAVAAELDAAANAAVAQPAPPDVGAAAAPASEHSRVRARLRASFSCVLGWGLGYMGPRCRAGCIR